MWSKVVCGAESRTVPNDGSVKRRVSLDFDSRSLIGDLWITSRTPRRLLRRSLRRPRDIEVQVVLDSLEEGSEDLTWEDLPMGRRRMLPNFVL